MKQKNHTKDQSVGAQQHFVTDSVISKDGTVIGYRQLGRGPGVVLLHGGVESAESHMQLAEVLADTFTVYLPDRRGRGMSGPYGEHYSSQRDVEDMDALLAKTGAHNVFGFSSGAIIWLKAALSLPAIQKAAIFEPPLLNNTDSWLPCFDKEIAEGKVAAALVTSTKGTEMWGHTMPRWLLKLVAKLIMSVEDKTVKADSVTMRKLAPTLHYDAQLIIETKGLLEGFRAICAEVLLVGGSRSPAYLKEGLDTLEKILPNAKRIEFPGLNHGASGNTKKGGRPKLVAAELRRFFA